MVTRLIYPETRARPIRVGERTLLDIRLRVRELENRFRPTQQDTRELAKLREFLRFQATEES